jgi:type IV pilus assembly protein PilV
MTNAVGCIESLGGTPGVYRITVAWQGMTQLSAPALSCGQGLYGNDGNRRAIDSLVTIANLSAP